MFGSVWESTTYSPCGTWKLPPAADSTEKPSRAATFRMPPMVCAVSLRVSEMLRFKAAHSTSRPPPRRSVSTFAISLGCSSRSSSVCAAPIAGFLCAAKSRPTMSSAASSALTGALAAAEACAACPPCRCKYRRHAGMAERLSSLRTASSQRPTSSPSITAARALPSSRSMRCLSSRTGRQTKRRATSEGTATPLAVASSTRSWKRMNSARKSRPPAS
mmetsp:Transcript_42610/g.135364  ORF Transcript_42610/g.135364 Transcript_42610/m.135364 type:complete len:218 (+) Transcript_42610:134-787(+)